MRYPAPALLALLGAAAVLLLGAALPAAQAMAASDDTIIIVDAGNSPDDVGSLYIDVVAGSQITSLTAHIMSGTTDELTVSDFTQKTGETWVVTSPITEAQLPIGSYTIDVDATDTGGASASVADVGSFQFLIVPSLTFTPSPKAIDYGHRTVAFSGSVSGQDPDGTSQPLAGVIVSLDGPNGPLAAPVTSADGSYQATVQLEHGGQVTATVASSSTTFAALSQVVIKVMTDKVKAVAKLSSTKVAPGGKLTVTGSVSYRSDSHWKPLAESEVQLLSVAPGHPQSVIATATTGTSGNFTINLTVKRDLDLQLDAGGLPGDEDLDTFLDLAQVNLPVVNVVVPVTLSDFAASIDPFGLVTGSVCETVVGGHFVAPALESAPRRAGPWSPLETLPRGRRCGQGREFTIKDSTRLVPAYFRVRYAGSAKYQPATSKVLYLSKYLTRITSFTVSPSSVSTNGHVTVKGRLWQHTKSWQPYAHREVLILFAYKHKVYAYKKKLTTDSAGWFTGRFQVLVSAPWFAQYDGDSKDFASASRSVKVTATTSNASPATRLPRHSGYLP